MIFHIKKTGLENKGLPSSYSVSEKIRYLNINCTEITRLKKNPKVLKSLHMVTKYKLFSFD